MATAKSKQTLVNETQRTFLIGPAPKSQRKAGTRRHLVRVYPVDAKSSKDNATPNQVELTADEVEALKGNLAFQAVMDKGLLQRA